MKTAFLPFLLALAVGAIALPANSATDNSLDRRQSAPLAGTCTIADNQCTVTFPGSTTPYNFTCGLTIILAGPTYIYEPDRCTVEGHSCTVSLAILGGRTRCGSS
ncbi:hypothetical protein B0T25DRAFT_629648 [Lasiosphaeria hispida]|uniref:Uncharacterized protein n=1 Tax=Lasiosphaeria hispida TaxID=260671 RepID=A0AAJ0HSF7_9PEZI|nr:hypothetical protein B0T25DRAFT_629648 [Lasiosphaeria hispida]